MISSQKSGLTGISSSHLQTFREWLESELALERILATQFLESRHQLLLKKWDQAGAPEGREALNKAVVAANPEVGVVKELVVEHEAAAGSGKAHKAMSKRLSVGISEGMSAMFGRSHRGDGGGQKQLALSDEDRERILMQRWPTSVRECVDHPYFELLFTFLIVLSAFQTALQLQYESFNTAASIDFTIPLWTGRFIAPDSETTWPGMEAFLDYANIFLGVLFIIEIVMKALAYKTQFVFSKWNCFDTLVIAIWVFDLFYTGKLMFNPMIMRLFRLARVLRLVRLMRTMNGMDALKLLVCSIQGSLSILIWSIVVLLAMMTLVGMVIAFLLQDDIKNPNLNLEKRQELFKYFGSFSRALLTMFELTLGNWIPVTRMLSETVSEWWALVLVLYNSMVGFAVVTVIRGVFLRETMKVAQSDDDLMTLEKHSAKNKFRTKMLGLIARADSSGEGRLDKDEFDAVMHDSNTRLWLSAMELDVRDADAAWDMLDDGDGHVDANELCEGFGKFKGFAKALDMHIVMRDLRSLQKVVTGVHSELTTLCMTFSQQGAQGASPQSGAASEAYGRYQPNGHQGPTQGYHRPDVFNDIAQADSNEFVYQPFAQTNGHAMITDAHRSVQRPMPERVRSRERLHGPGEHLHSYHAGGELHRRVDNLPHQGAAHRSREHSNFPREDSAPRASPRASPQQRRAPVAFADNEWSERPV